MAGLRRGQGPFKVDGDEVIVIFVELDIWYVLCPKRPKNGWEQSRRHRHMPQRFFCDLNVSFYSNISMASTLCELALLQAEVPNAASLALAVLALSETGLAEQARAVGCGERCRPTHTHEHHNKLAHPQRPFTALSCIPCSWKHHLHLYRTARAILHCTRHFC